MSDGVNAISVILLALNLYALGTSRILTMTHIAAAQGILLGILSLWMHHHPSVAVVAASVAAIALKGFVMPALIIQALRNAHIQREVEPLIGFMPSLILGALATAFALLLSDQLPLASEHQGSLLAPTAMATFLIGFLILVSRFKAITQVIGYLILENGIFLFGLFLIDAMPLVLEMGILLDLLVGVFIACIIINHINRAFLSMDTRRLASLKE